MRQKEVEKARQKKITFPLCLRFMPPLTRDEAAMDGGGLLHEASWGFCGWGKQERPWRIQPFLSFSHSLRQRTFDQPTMTGLLVHYEIHPAEKSRGQVSKQLAEKKWRLDHLNRSLLRDLRALNNTEENILSFSQVFFFFHLTPLPLFFSLHCPFLYCMILSRPPCLRCPHCTECLNAVNYPKGKVCTCWKAILACLAC